MRMTKPTGPRRQGARVRGERNGKRESFRDLKAFGLWADREDLKDPVRLLVSFAHAWSGEPMPDDAVLIETTILVDY
jgi:hypothetical protein